MRSLLPLLRRKSEDKAINVALIGINAEEITINAEEIICYFYALFLHNQYCWCGYVEVKCVVKSFLLQ